MVHNPRTHCKSVHGTRKNSDGILPLDDNNIFAFFFGHYADKLQAEILGYFVLTWGIFQTKRTLPKSMWHIQIKTWIDIMTIISYGIRYGSKMSVIYGKMGFCCGTTTEAILFPYIHLH